MKGVPKDSMAKETLARIKGREDLERRPMRRSDKDAYTNRTDGKGRDTRIRGSGIVNQERIWEGGDDPGTPREGKPGPFKACLHATEKHVRAISGSGRSDAKDEMEFEVGKLKTTEKRAAEDTRSASIEGTPVRRDVGPSGQGSISTELGGWVSE